MLRCRSLRSLPPQLLLSCLLAVVMHVMTISPNCSTRKKIHHGVTVRGNSHRVSPQFAKELREQYSNDPELAAWIAEHAKELDQPNPDGTIPFATQHLDDYERGRFLRADTATNYVQDPTLSYESCQ